MIVVELNSYLYLLGSRSLFGVVTRLFLRKIWKIAGRGCEGSCFSISILKNRGLMWGTYVMTHDPMIIQGEVGSEMASRKGCFKCGNLGHIAENCISENRLCYNCRQVRFFFCFVSFANPKDS